MESSPGSAAVPPGPPVPSLGREAGMALRWNAASSGVTVLSQFLQIVVLARWLGPSEFGVAAAALAVVAFLAGLTDLGLSNALVQHESLSDKSWASAWWATAAVGTVFGVLLVPAAPFIAGALHLRDMAPLLVVGALALPWSGPAAVYQADLQRRLRFRRLAIVEMAAALASLGAALGWAVWRHDAMALVVGVVTLAVLRFAGLSLASPLRPAPRLRWNDLRPLSAFGGWQMAERLASHALVSLDRLVVARLLGPAAAGYYFMASQIALKPAALLAPFASRTLLPLLARIRHDRARTASSYLRSVSLLSLAAAAAYSLLLGLAQPLLALVLGRGWEPAVPVLQALAVVGFLLVPGNALGNLTLALGRAGMSFWVALLVLLARIGAVVVGARYGLEGVAIAVLIVTALSLIIDFELPRRWLGVRYRELARAGGWPLIPGGVAAAAMAILAPRLPFPPLAQILVAGLMGCLVFIGIAWVFQRNLLMAAWRELVEKMGK